MSKRTVGRPTEIVACDYCNKEINARDKKEWAHIIREFISPPTNRARHLIFHWPSKVTFSSIDYDFHAECFDKMVTEMKERKRK